MAKLNFVKQARKDIIRNDKIIVAKGESYYWWQFAFQKKQVSKTQPSRQQLTQSEYQKRMYDFDDELEGFANVEIETWQDKLESLISEVQDYKDELEDNLSNMPKHLQESSVLNERIDSLDSAITELEFALIWTLKNLNR